MLDDDMEISGDSGEPESFHYDGEYAVTAGDLGAEATAREQSRRQQRMAGSVESRFILA